MVLDFPPRQRGKVTRTDIGHAVVGPAIGGSEMAVFEPDSTGEGVHLAGEGLLGATDALSKNDRSVVA